MIWNSDFSNRDYTSEPIDLMHICSRCSCCIKPDEGVLFYDPLRFYQADKYEGNFHVTEYDTLCKDCFNDMFSDEPMRVIEMFGLGRNI